MGLRRREGKVAPPLAERKQQEQNPERRHGEVGPAVQAQGIEPATPAAGLIRRTAARAGADEFQVRAHLGVARGKLLREPVGFNGAAKLAELEQGVAAVEKQGLGRAALEQLIVSGEGIGILAFLVKLVGGSRSRRAQIRGVQARKRETTA